MSDIALVLIIILLAVLLFRAPKTLPQIGAALGRGVREARANVSRDLGGGNEDDDEERPAPSP